MNENDGIDDAATRGTAGEVFAVFLKLGLTAFGGPIAHLGYFRDELVVRRRWLSEHAYADLVALCQFLPGPASSQVGFSLGLLRAGWPGALAAFTAFTLPSALILFLFAISAASFTGPLATGILHGLKIVAVAIVAQAVLGMARTLCPDRERAAIAVLAVVVLAVAPGAFGMVGSILLGALVGLVFLKAADAPVGGHVAVPVSRAQSIVSLTVFGLLLVALPLAAGGSQMLNVADSFFRAGSLVFGGGHVVLPLLEAEVVAPGWVTADTFLAGYGAAQAVPGPLFTFAAYLGAALGPEPNGLAGAALALAFVFLPGFLILVAVLPWWDRFRAMAKARSLMQGANAAVVGILAAALYSPVFTGAVKGLPDFALALGCFVALVAWKAPPWLTVAAAAVGGAALSLGG